MFKTAIQAFLSCCLLCGGAMANDTELGGNGATPIPIQNDQISMKDEHVVLEGVTGPFHRALLHWKVTCTFHFKNESSTVQKLTMGFPFPQWIDIHSEYSRDKLEDLSPESREYLLQPSIRNFTTTVRGKAIEAKESKLETPDSSYAMAYIWDVEFAPGETVEVVNTYEHNASNQWDGTEFISYVLMTGKNWKGGKIGRSLLEVRPKVKFKSPVSDEDGFVYGSDPKGGRWKADGEFKKRVWDLKNFTPQTDLFFAYKPDRESWDLDLFDLERKTLEKKDASCEELRILRNAYYAPFGYPFKSEDLRSYFGKYNWYKANPKFDVNKITAQDRKRLFQLAKVVKDLETKKGCK